MLVLPGPVGSGERDHVFGSRVPVSDQGSGGLQDARGVDAQARGRPSSLNDCLASTPGTFQEARGGTARSASVTYRTAPGLMEASTELAAVHLAASGGVQRPGALHSNSGSGSRPQYRA